MFSYEKKNDWYKHMLADFNVIEGFEDWIYPFNKECVNYLNDTVEEGSIVITHHMPSNKSVSKAFLTSHLNRFFVCPMDDLIEQRRPALWIHGHTHDSKDYKLYNTRILCNPFGYMKKSFNIKFNKKLVIEV